MIDAEAVLFPAGRIKAAFFPTLTLNELLDAIDVWISEAYEDPRVVDLDEAAQGRAAKRWAQHRGFSEVSGDMANDPSEVGQTDAGRYAFSKDQRDWFRDQAAKELAAFEETVIPSAWIWSGSRSVRHVFEH